MPWIDEELCVGCGVCVESCPAEAIVMEESLAVLDMESCLRCGICHDVCPVGAVEHDSKLTERDVNDQVGKTLAHARDCVRIKGDVEDGWASLKRHIKHYQRQKLVAEKILHRLGHILEEGDAKWV